MKEVWLSQVSVEAEVGVIILSWLISDNKRLVSTCFKFHFSNILNNHRHYNDVAQLWHNVRVSCQLKHCNVSFICFLFFMLSFYFRLRKFKAKNSNFNQAWLCTLRLHKFGLLYVYVVIFACFRNSCLASRNPFLSNSQDGGSTSIATHCRDDEMYIRAL